MRLRSRRNLRLFPQFFWFIFHFLNTNTCGSSTYASLSPIFLVPFLDANTRGSSTRAFFFNLFGSFLRHRYVWELLSACPPPVCCKKREGEGT